MYVTRRQRYSTIENSQEEMIRVATINRDLFQTLLFSCISRKKSRARTIRSLMAYIRKGKLYLRENHINVSGIENLYQLVNHVSRSVKSKSTLSL